MFDQFHQMFLLRGVQQVTGDKTGQHFQQRPAAGLLTADTQQLGCLGVDVADQTIGVAEDHALLNRAQGGVGALQFAS